MNKKLRDFLAYSTKIEEVKKEQSDIFSNELIRTLEKDSDSLMMFMDLSEREIKQLFKEVYPTLRESLYSMKSSTVSEVKKVRNEKNADEKTPSNETKSVVNNAPQLTPGQAANTVCYQQPTVPVQGQYPQAAAPVAAPYVSGNVGNQNV